MISIDVFLDENNFHLLRNFWFNIKHALKICVKIFHYRILSASVRYETFLWQDKNLIEFIFHNYKFNVIKPEFEIDNVTSWSHIKCAVIHVCQLNKVQNFNSLACSITEIWNPYCEHFNLSNNAYDHSTKPF